MRELESGIKRLAIYVVYDKDGIIDDYIPYYLNDLAENVSHFVIVCNGKLSEDGRAKLERFTDDIYVRPNTGFDAGAHKDVLLNYLGWDKVYEYDELLLCNDTVFGPLFPFRRVFDKMDKRKVGFWGLVEGVKREAERVPRHVQSFFINFKAVTLKSSLFKDFWIGLQEPQSLTEAVTKFEFGLSSLLTNHGYRYEVYSDSFLFSEAEGFHTIYYDPHISASYFDCPIIKKRSFFDLTAKNKWGFHGGESYFKLIDYIKKETSYEVDLIWEYILRCYDIKRIRDILRLNYSFTNETMGNENLTLKSAVVVICTNVDSLYYQSRVSTLPHSLRVVLIIGKHGIRELIHYLNKYEYLCYVHLAKRETQRELITDFNLVWENMLCGEAFIKNILTCFSQNSKLGYLASPKPYHGTRFVELATSWDGDFHDMKALADVYGFGEKLHEKFPPFPVSDAFWCRTNAVKTLLGHAQGYNERIIEKLLPYVAQSNGYYSGTIMSDRYSASRNIDLEYILSGIIKKIHADWDFNDYGSLQESPASESLLRFCYKHSITYIYGAGKYADKCAEVLERNDIEYSGFVVSDENCLERTFRGRKVYCLSELPSDKRKYGIILGLGKKNTEEVSPVLAELGFTNLFRLNFT